MSRTRRLPIAAAAVLLLSAVLAGIGTIRPDTAHAASVETATIGMPFNGKWAWNVPAPAPWNDNVNDSHPAAHPLSGMEWSVDLYAPAGANVHLFVPGASGNLSFSWGSAGGSCGQSRRINVHVDGQHIGSVYFTHLSGAVAVGSPISNGMVVGQVGNLGCVAPHLHMGFDTAGGGNSCYIDHGRPGSRTIAANTPIGIVGAQHAGTQSRCNTGSSDYNGDALADLVMFSRNDTGSGKTAVHLASGANFQQNVLSSATWIGRTDNNNWAHLTGDYNRDGIADFWFIGRDGTGSNTTEIHIANGANPNQVLLHSTSGIHETPGNGWAYALGDHNVDGYLDLYVIAKRDGGTGRTAVHIHDGRNFNTRLLSTATWIGATDTGWWSHLVGDQDVDGQPDMWFVARSGTGSGKTEVHVATGASNYTQRGLQAATWIHQTPGDAWTFSLGDINGDARPDLWAIIKNDPGSGKTAVHVMNGANVGQNVRSQPTWLHPTEGIGWAHASG